jgi:hypothetical protein
MQSTRKFQILLKKNGLKGFYMIAGRDLPLKGLDIDVDVIVAKAYVEVPMAGVDASFYMNFANGQKDFGGGMDGGIKVLFGLGSITCTSLSGSALATIGIKGGYEGGRIKLEGKQSFSTNLSIKQGVPVVKGCKTVFSETFGVSGGFEFKAVPHHEVNFYID